MAILSIFLKIVICGGSRKQLELYPYRYCPRHDRNVTLKFERKLFYVNSFLRGERLLNIQKWILVNFNLEDFCRLEQEELNGKTLY